MIDIKYFIIRLLQYVVLFSNIVQKIFIRDKKIRLKWNEHLLIIKLDRIWDAVWTVRFVEQLKNNYPKLKVSILCNEYNRFIFEDHNWLVDIINVIDEPPQWYLVKHFYRLFKYIIDPFYLYFKNIDFFDKLKSEDYDFVLNLTWRNCFYVANKLWKSMWWWLWIFNFIYDYPLIWHNEIWSDIHIVQKRLNKFSITSKVKFSLKKEIKNILLFIWWKSPNRMDLFTYMKIKRDLEKEWYIVKVLSDYHTTHTNFVIEKKLNWFYVWKNQYVKRIWKFDLFIWVDGWVLHYTSQFINTLWLYASTNVKVAYPYGWGLELIRTILGVKIYLTADYRHLILSRDLKCQWCFQIWCNKRFCLFSIDKRKAIINNTI